MFEYNVIVKENLLQKDMYYKDTIVLTYTIKSPQFISGQFQIFLEELNAYYETKAFIYENTNIINLYQMAIKEYEYSVANGFPVRKYETFIDYEITYNQNCILSLYFDQYEYTGGAHGNTIRYSDTWNLQNGKRIELSDVFSCRNNHQEYVIQNIYDQIKNEIMNGSNPYFENYQQLVLESFEEDNFYLTQEGVVIYFQHYDIAPYSSGIPTFTIPYSC